MVVIIGFFSSRFSNIDGDTAEEAVESLPRAFNGDFKTPNNVDEVEMLITRPTVDRRENIYYQEIDLNGTPLGDKFLIAIADTAYGVKANDDDDWIAFVDNQATLRFKERPLGMTQLLASGYPGNTSYINALWKCAAVAGRQVYIGNVVQPTEADGGADDTVYNTSKILKGSINKKYGFPDTQYINLDIGGDAITVMEAVGDRLFVFTNNDLFIINISQDFEYLEGQFDNMGVSGPNKVCKVGEGLAWGNDTGVYLFDGQKTLSLSDDKMMNGAQWDKITGMGYEPIKKNLIVFVSHLNGSSNLAQHVFSFKTKAWVATLDHDNTNQQHVNTQILTYNGAMYWLYGVTSYTELGTVTPEYDGEGQSSIAILETGRLHLGDLSRNKKIYKIYVTCKNSHSGGETTLDYAVNGGAYTGSPMNFTTVTGRNEFDIAGVSNARDIQLKITFTNIDYDFEISDIAIIYREKVVK